MKMGLFSMIGDAFKRSSHKKKFNIELAFDATERAKRAREIANRKIDDIYAQLDGRGDKWFLTSEKDDCSTKED